jgi:hypothetical protein
MRCLPLVGVLLLLAACSPSEELRLAEREVTKFRDLVDAGAYDVLYVGTAQRLKDVTSEAQFVAMLERTHGSLGKLRRSERNDWSVEADTSDGIVVKLGYATSYEHGDRKEEYTYLIRGQHAALAQYAIRVR